MTTFLLAIVAGVIGGIIASLINEFVLRPRPTKVGLKRAARLAGDAVRRRSAFRCPNCGNADFEEDWSSGGWPSFEEGVGRSRYLVTVEKYKCEECGHHWIRMSRELQE